MPNELIPIKQFEAELREAFATNSSVLFKTDSPETWVSPLGRALADAKRHADALEERVKVLEMAIEEIDRRINGNK